MSKTLKTCTILLALVLVMQLFSAAPAVFADGADDAASVLWTLNARDAEGAERSCSGSRMRRGAG